MQHFMIVEQSVDNVEVVKASNLPKQVLNRAVAKVFPVGSDWGKFVNARSFRFTSLTKDFYMLSYTFVLGEKQNEWNGTLRSWALIDHKNVFMAVDGLVENDPQQLFQNHLEMFSDDPKYRIMKSGLSKQLSKRKKTKLPFIVRFLTWAGFNLPYIFSLPYENLSKWCNVETVLYHQWLSTVKSPIRKKADPVPFVTFTLSKRGEKGMKGIPLNS